MKKSSVLSFVLAALFFVGTGTLHAQDEERKSNRVIATDFNECLTGIKDTLGNWIVKPQYSYIRNAEGGRFIVTVYDGVSRSGLIDSNGRVIFPVMFMYIHQSQVDDYYEAHLRGKDGIISSRGDTVVPFRYYRIAVKEDTSFWARKKYGKWIHYDVNGKSWKLSHRQKSSPAVVGNGMYLVTKGRWLLHSKSGLLNDSGNTIVPIKYDAINDGPQAIFMQNKKKFGYLDSTGKQMWPMVFDATGRAREQHSYAYSWDWDYNYNSEDPLGYDTVAIVSNTNKYGIISGSGREHLPLIYDDIYNDYYNRESDIRLYTVRQDTNYGLFDTRRGWILPMEYQHINVISLYYAGPDSIPTALYVAEKNNLYGVSTTSGQIILPLVYKHYSYTSAGYVFYNNDTLTKLYMYPSFLKSAVVRSQDNIAMDSSLASFDLPVNILDLPTDGYFKKYSAENGLTLFYNPDHFHDTLYNGDKKYVAGPQNRFTEIPDSILIATSIAITTVTPKMKIGEDYLLYIDSAYGLKPSNVASSYLLMNKRDSYTMYIREMDSDSHFTYFETTNNMLFRNDGKILIPYINPYYNVRVLDYGNSNLQFIVTDSKRRFAIMNYDGSFETEFGKGSLGKYSDQYMWIGNGSLGGSNWKLYDRRTKRQIAVPKGSGNSVINGNFIQFISKKHGHTLYNLRTESIVAQNYNEITPLDREGSMYEVVTCSGNVGVIDSAGRIVLDTVYMSRVPLRERAKSEFYYYWSYGATESYSRYHSFYNNSGRILFDVKTRKAADDSIARNYMLRYLCVYDDTATFQTIKEKHHEKNGINTTYFITNKSDSSKLQSWHVQTMADTLCAPYRFETTRWGDIRGNQQYNCAYCYKRTHSWSYITPSTGPREFLIRVNSDSMFSYHEVTRYSSSSWFSNVLLFKDGPRNVTLDSLFNPQTDWRNFVMNNVVDYVNTHLYVEGDCHNPAGFPILLNQRFVLTDDGIVLYPEDFLENDEELSILIPWTDAMPYLRRDVQTKVPVQKR